MKRIQDILLIIVFAFSIFLYSYSLSTQEFVGDEAGPMLSIDRMWDSIPLKDIRFLAYPYLFYHEPYRAIFSGTLLHFFGPDRIILRLPSVIFGLLTFGLLTYIFKKEKVAPWLAILAMVTYFISPLITYDRSGRLSDQSSFFFLLTSYLIWQGSRQNNIQKLRLSLITFAISVLTILDSIILVPGIISVFIKKRLLIDRKTTYLISCLILLGTLYFIAWLVLPYLTFRSGFQNYYDNRGLFYYISRARSGILTSPLEGLKSLINYTSIPFSLWIILTSVLALKIKKFLYIYIIGLSAWVAVIFLNHSSSHIMMYTSFFLYQAVIVTDYFIKKNILPIKIFTVIFLAIIVGSNSINLYSSYLQMLKPPTCLDNSVLRLYTDHNKIAPQKPCELPIKNR